MLSVLFIAYVFSFVDRQILALMVEPIKRDFGLSDTEFSLLHGLVFSIFYALLGLPVGRLMDTSRRTRLISAGVALWSLMCAGCGVVQSFWGMFACRLGIGVGATALSPGASSLISDYFPPARRARALAIYSLGITVGAGLAFVFGGMVVDIAATQQGTILPLLGEVASWQLVFIAVGLPGLLVALMVLTIREPVRREQLFSKDGSSDLSIADIRRFLGTNAQLFSCLFVGLGLVSLASYALLAWIPITFIRPPSRGRGCPASSHTLQHRRRAYIRHPVASNANGKPLPRNAGLRASVHPGAVWINSGNAACGGAESDAGCHICGVSVRHEYSWFGYWPHLRGAHNRSCIRRGTHGGLVDFAGVGSRATCCAAFTGSGHSALSGGARRVSEVRGFL
ncbi:MAG: MFS transporter [Haliea sp.]